MLREEPQKCSDDTGRDLISDSSSSHMETNLEKLSKMMCCQVLMSPKLQSTSHVSKDQILKRSPGSV